MLIAACTMSIFLDFDGTITAKDTIGELANSALRIQQGRGSDLQRQWKHVVKAYMDDCKQHDCDYHVAEDKRTLAEQEVAYLREMKGVEIRSLDRIRDSSVFKGIESEQLRQAGRDALAGGIIRFRDGFGDFVEARRREGWKMYVISVNWSTAFIEGCISQTPNECIEVIANEISAEDGSIAGPAFLNADPESPPRILTNSMDKLEVLRRLIQRNESEDQPSFYLGDSGTDLECLLAVTTGIVMADEEEEDDQQGSSKLLRTLGRIGMEAPHVKLTNKEQTQKQQQIWWASSFTEIEANISFQSIAGPATKLK
jgi:thiamine phosphate phosphatase / amino-HMP aminohydrolase